MPLIVGNSGTHVLSYDLESGNEQNCLVVCITTGQEALEFLRKDAFAFDLVITDYPMPGMTGIELSREVAGRAPEFASYSLHRLKTYPQYPLPARQPLPHLPRNR